MNINVRESQLEYLFVKAVRGALGGTVIKLAPTMKGVPDRLVILPGGLMYLVELKTEVGRPSPAQRVWHENVKKLGVTVYTLHGPVQIKAWVRDRAQEVMGMKPTRAK